MITLLLFSHLMLGNTFAQNSELRQLLEQAKAENAALEVKAKSTSGSCALERLHAQMSYHQEFIDAFPAVEKLDTELTSNFAGISAKIAKLLTLSIDIVPEDKSQTKLSIKLSDLVAYARAINSRLMHASEDDQAMILEQAQYSELNPLHLSVTQLQRAINSFTNVLQSSLTETSAAKLEFLVTGNTMDLVFTTAINIGNHAHTLKISLLKDADTYAKIPSLRSRWELLQKQNAGMDILNLDASERYLEAYKDVVSESCQEPWINATIYRGITQPLPNLSVFWAPVPSIESFLKSMLPTNAVSLTLNSDLDVSYLFVRKNCTNSWHLTVGDYSDCVQMRPYFFHVRDELVMITAASGNLDIRFHNELMDTIQNVMQLVGAKHFGKTVMLTFLTPNGFFVESVDGASAAAVSLELPFQLTGTPSTIEFRKSGAGSAPDLFDLYSNGINLANGIRKDAVFFKYGNSTWAAIHGEYEMIWINLTQGFSYRADDGSAFFDSLEGVKSVSGTPTATIRTRDGKTLKLKLFNN